MIIGVLGGGQLARMLAMAGYPLGLEFIFFCPERDACAAPLGEHICAGFDDESALARLAERADVVTYEFENVPVQAVQFLSERVSVCPPAAALGVTQDRLREKHMFQALDIAIAPFAAVDSLDDLANAVKHIGLPALLKTRTQGYDGKGQTVLRCTEDLEAAWKQLRGVPSIVEAFIPFERELSVIAVRGSNGETAFYPLAENTHENGILRLSVSHPGDPMQAQAERYAQRLLDELAYVGVLALELFQVGDELLVNEFAPRVHNSGHWTIEGAETSQFQNHLRAIVGWPLGSTAPSGYAAMVNFIGTLPDSAQILTEPYVHLHDYGKVSRPGRKVGHATLHVASEQTLNAGLGKLLALSGVNHKSA